MCAFPFCFDDSVGSVRGVGYGVFVTVGIESNFDYVMFVMFVPIVVESKGGRIIEIFWRLKSLFSLQISKSVL